MSLVSLQPCRCPPRPTIRTHTAEQTIAFTYSYAMAWQRCLPIFFFLFRFFIVARLLLLLLFIVGSHAQANININIVLCTLCIERFAVGLVAGAGVVIWLSDTVVAVPGAH